MNFNINNYWYNFILFKK